MSKWIRQYNIDGVYEEVETKVMYVPIDVVNYMPNKETGLMEFLKNPFVICRHLDMDVKEHKRYAILLSEFNTKFQKA